MYRMHSLLELSGEQTAVLLDGIMLSHSRVLLDKVEVGAALSIAALLKLSLPHPIKTAALSSEYCSAGSCGDLRNLLLFILMGHSLPQP